MPAVRSVLSEAVDRSLEVSIAGSFSRIGYLARRAVSCWPDPPRLDGRTVLVTGASSGIGRAAAARLAGLGAQVWLTGRDEERLAAAAGEARGARAERASPGGEGPSGAGAVRTFSADLVDPGQTEALVAAVTAGGGVDAVVHNAGALFRTYRQAPDGTELTLATHLLAPFRLTSLLHPLLRRNAEAGPSAIVTVSSGGMYTEPFDLDRLEMGPDGYRGAVAYARAKRAQVVLTHEWARRFAGDGISAHCMHPGWVTTPGLESGLPSFTRLGPALRSPAEGADTIVWLTATALSPGAGGIGTGGFWHDRRRRGESYRPGTGRSAEQDLLDGTRLWDYLADRTGTGG